MFNVVENNLSFREIKQKLLKLRSTDGGLLVTKYRIRNRYVQQRVVFPNGTEHWVNYKLLSEVLKEVKYV
jgi:hypothetical protein